MHWCVLGSRVWRPYLLRGLRDSQLEQVLLKLEHLGVDFGGCKPPVLLCVGLLCHHHHCLPPRMHRAAGGGHMSHGGCCPQHSGTRKTMQFVLSSA